MKEFADSHYYQQFVSNNYHFLAIFSALSFAFSNFTLSYLSANPLGFWNFAMMFNPVFFGFLLYAGIFHLKAAFELKRKHGVFWSREHSCYFDFHLSLESELKNINTQSIEENNHSNVNAPSASIYKVNWLSIWAVFLRFALYIFAQLIYYGASYSAYRANVNLSIILNIMQINPFLTAFIFYFAFKEKVKKTHILGMILMATCITINCLSQNSEDLNGLGTDVQNIVVPILCVLATSILFCITNWTNRYYPPLTGMRSQQYVADTFGLSGIFFLIMTFIFPHQYKKEELIIVLLQSAFVCAALSLAGEVMAYGKAGPGQALIELESFFLLVMEVIFWQRYPNLLQTIAFIIGMGGGALIAFDH